MIGDTMEPNLQPTSPIEEPTVDIVPEAKEPDTSSFVSPISSQSNNYGTTGPIQNSQEAVPVNPPNTFPSTDQNVVASVTPQSTITQPAVSGASPKKNTRKILIIILAVVILAAAGLIIYVTTMV